jgi:hypothetical protein
VSKATGISRNDEHHESAGEKRRMSMHPLVASLDGVVLDTLRNKAPHALCESCTAVVVQVLNAVIT